MTRPIYRIVPTIVLSCLLAFSACANEEHTGIQHSPIPTEKQAAKRLLPVVDRMFKLSERIDSHGTVDTELWRLIVYVLNDEGASQHMAVPILKQLVEKRPMYKPAALALLEDKCIRSKRSDVSGKTLFLVEFAWFQDIHAGNVLNEVQKAHQSRITNNGRMDANAEQYIGSLLNDKRVAVQMGAIPLLLQASALRSEDRSWALQRVERHMKPVQGNALKFWKVVREAIVGEIEG